MLKQIVTGILLAVAGFFMIYFSNQLRDISGPIDRAEKNLGNTRNAYVLFGFGIIVIGLLILFGVISFNSPVA